MWLTSLLQRQIKPAFPRPLRQQVKKHGQETAAKPRTLRSPNSPLMLKPPKTPRSNPKMGALVNLPAMQPLSTGPNLSQDTEEASQPQRTDGPSENPSSDPAPGDEDPTVLPPPLQGEPTDFPSTAPGDAESSRSQTTEAAETVTDFPPEAELVTLSGGTQTEPEYITTTREGSDEETVVPVIIPFSGPPVACFGCVGPSPPNIKIDVPDFCVQLVGIDIGKCPPEENQDEDEDEEECTQSVTATYVSVFCTVTETANQRRQEPSEDCSSLAYSTVKDCSVTNLETTVTATATKSPAEPTRALCEQSTCGGDECAPPQQKRSLGNSTLDPLVKRGDPDEGEPAGPEDYSNSVSKFVAGEVFLGYYGTDGLIEDAFGTVVKLASPAMGSVTTSNSLVFGEKVEQIAISGLYGCTSVIAISKKGVFVSHTWEPDMQDHAQTFQAQAIHGVHVGLGNEYHPFGLDELRNNPGASPEGIGTIFGDSRSGANNSLDVQVYIVTPRPSVPYFQIDAAGMITRTPDDVLTDVNALAGQRRYAARVIDLFQDLEAFFEDVGSASIDVVDYAPIQVPWSWYDERNAATQAVLDAPEGEARNEAQRELDKHLGTYYEIRGDRDNSNPRGKALVQYRPAHDCDDQAQWRVWVEGRGVEDRKHAWKPLPGQVFERDGDGSCDSADDDSADDDGSDNDDDSGGDDDSGDDDDSGGNDDDSGGNDDDSGGNDDSGDDDESGDEDDSGDEDGSGDDVHLRPPPGGGVNIP